MFQGVNIKRRPPVLGSDDYVVVPPSGAIEYSVDIWSSIHQDASVLRADGPAIAAVYLQPLLLGFLGQILITASLIMLLMRAEIYDQRGDALIARKLSEA